MTAIEFDSWLAPSEDGRYQPESLNERNATSELHALREWSALTREAARLQKIFDLETATSALAGPDSPLLRSTEARLNDTRREAARLAANSKSAGWQVE